MASDAAGETSEVVLKNLCGMTVEAAVLKEDPRICEPGGNGLLLPLGGDAEIEWDNRLKVLLYGFGLVYCFLGVSIVADMFMAAIERITSKQTKVKVPGSDRMVTVQVWNETVANLTLMALGSSAPEILLALNDVLKNEFFEGKLGPSTIVGSAAFNLFCIIAVCINSIPNGEVRVIKETGVFAVTAVWSIFAYVWLLFIVQFNSKDVVEVWEGVITFCFFPLLVTHSLATDEGWISRENIKAFVMDGVASMTSGDEDEEEEFSCMRLFCKICYFCCVVIGRAIMYVLRKVCSLFMCCAGVFCFCCIRRRKADYDQADAADPDTAAIVEGSGELKSGEFGELEETILDEDGQPIEHEAGIMTFKADVFHVSVGQEEKTYTVPVFRKNGDRGRVTVKYCMVSLTAVPGYDYNEDEGELNFRDGVLEQELEMTILPKGIGERNDKFQVVIEDETGTVIFNPYRDGGEEKNILTVHIRNENPPPRQLKHRIYRFLDKTFNVDELKLGSELWKEQILEAVFCNGSKEAQDSASFLDWVVHLIWVPWKVPFAILTPPPTYLGGWICFTFSLLHIGGLTVIVGDLAELFGCALGIDDEITAISIVALGTSVPDLFASRSAAKQDEYADASIVNVTGSNSVNVFLGIGLPWMWAALYWKIAGADSEWVSRYGEAFPELCTGGGAAFIVRSGQLFFSVCVFTLAACVCLVVIKLRRIMFGGELGGPSDVKAYSSFLLVMLWFFYIALSVWKLMTKTEDGMKLVAAIGFALPIVLVALFLFSLLLQGLKFSKRFIGEEGFWGLFVAGCIIGGRMFIFFVFQMQ
mmetsp:Transcript_9069/g.22638  ORF Transcript_9069/g.22638 Transcript_9069/m.22638 type:complete len:814 (-) Transcript_9069:102-2543(-)